MRILKVAGVGIGFVAVGVAALVAGAWLKVHVGEWPLLALAGVLGAAWVATPEARQAAAAIRRTLAGLGLSEKVAALILEMDFAQCSRQLNCVERLNLVRWFELGPDFRRRFYIESLKDEGGVLCIEDERVARIMRRLEGAA